MKQLKKDLKAVAKSLKQLTRKTDQMAKRLDKLAKVPAAKKPKKRPAKRVAVKKRAKATAIDTVYSIIKKSKKGVNAATLKKKSGFENKKIWNNINMLKVKGKIKSVKRGVYVTK